MNDLLANLKASVLVTGTFYLSAFVGYIVAKEAFNQGPDTATTAGFLSGFAGLMALVLPCIWGEEDPKPSDNEIEVQEP